MITQFSKFWFSITKDPEEGDEDINKDEDNKHDEDDVLQNEGEDKEWLADQVETAVQVFIDKDFSNKTSSGYI